MQKKCILSLLSVIISFIIYSQEDSFWDQKASFKIDSNDIWAVDVLGNTYITKKETIQKYDSVGKFKFSQSQKSSGRLSSIQTVNTMKLVVFSEEQQEMCFFDNTLTAYESCVDFSDYQISNASSMAVSSQPDKFWVYDQLNSRLHLLSLEQTDQAQEIENLKGMLNSIQLTSMFEADNFLYLIDLNQGIFILDIYGSLVNFINRRNIKGFQVDNKNYYFLEEKNLIIINKETNQEIEIVLPSKEITEFKKMGNSYFFRSPQEIRKYHLFLVK